MLGEYETKTATEVVQLLGEIKGGIFFQPENLGKDEAISVAKEKFGAERAFLVYDIPDGVLAIAL